MGKSLSILNITGHFEGLSFYRLNGQIVVRRTGGFDSKKLKTDPKYARVREQNQEFKQSSVCGKYFRKALGAYAQKLQITYLHSRVLQLFQQITQLDAHNPRGTRMFFEGLKTAPGKALFEGFEFHPEQTFAAVFTADGHWNTEQASFTLCLSKTKPLQAPAGATHWGWQLLQLGLDFEQLAPAQFYETEPQLFSFTQANHEPPISSLTVPQDNAPTQITLLYVSFYQEQATDLVPLSPGYMKVVALKNSDL